MEQLLNKILRNQLIMSEEIIKIQSNQVEIMKQMKKINNLQNKMDNLKNEMNHFNEETVEYLKKIEDELHANLDDISYIFREYDSKFAKMK